MKKTQEMIDFVKNYDLSYDTYDIWNLYNDFSNEFDLKTSFDITDNGSDIDIICSVWSKKIDKAIVLSWSCKNYRDSNFYNDIINYLLELDEEARDILDIID